MFHKKSWRLYCRAAKHINVVDEQPEGGDIDPSFTLFTTSQCLNEPELHALPHAYSVFRINMRCGVLMANACGSSALCGMKAGSLHCSCRLRFANTGGLRTTEGWQGRYHSITLRSFGEEWNHIVAVIDTETCGLQGGIVEIALCRCRDGNIVNPMSHLIRPDRPITPQAMAIHTVLPKPWSPISRGLKMSYRFITVVVSMSLTMPVFDRRVLPELPGEVDLYHEVVATPGNGDKIQQYGAL